MLVKTLGYIWMTFGLYWVIVAPGRRARDSRPARAWRVPVLVASFLLLFWERAKLPAVALILMASAWAAAALYWATPGKRSNSGERDEGESGLYRPLRLAILVSSFVLLFWQGAAKGWLGGRFLPPTEVLPYAGLLVTLGGLLVAFWARLHLGRHWSDRIQLTPDHQLIRTGPYRCLRHPIYSGVLAAVAGTALAIGEWRAALAFALLLSSYSIKARREEHILAERFGREFEEHRRRTGFLLPPLVPRRPRAER